MTLAFLPLGICLGGVDAYIRLAISMTQVTADNTLTFTKILHSKRLSLFLLGG